MRAFIGGDDLLEVSCWPKTVPSRAASMHSSRMEMEKEHGRSLRDKRESSLMARVA